MFDTLMVFLKGYLEKDDLNKNQQVTNTYEKLPCMLRVNLGLIVLKIETCILFV